MGPSATDTPSTTTLPAPAPSDNIPVAAVTCPIGRSADDPNIADVVVEDETPSDGIDRTDWSESLIQAHRYCSTKAWGATWTALLSAWVQFEWLNYHHEDNGRLSSSERPSEIPQWMKEHRVYDDYEVGENFGEQLLGWWKQLGPRRRWQQLENERCRPARDAKEWEDWGRLGSSGRNGPLLIVLGLAWWGQKIWNEGSTEGLDGGEAALAAADDWHFLVEDLTWALDKILQRDREGEEAEEKEQKEREVEKERDESARQEAEKQKKGKKGGAKSAAKRQVPEPLSTAITRLT
ncbi:hypothetical protein B0H13DRAFT_1663835 [Mycena leptocephala]|nr:hypothetical protein B0H13DRAFT_1663835 [Mycena leptocephala]